MNPYKYTGPLDPVEDKIVMVPRTEERDKVIDGINYGRFWSILGPRQLGKSTFLRQLDHILSSKSYCLYFNFEILPTRDEKNFYKWLMDQFCIELASEAEVEVDSHELENFEPHFRFYHFLTKFKPGDQRKRVILLFDEIERIPGVKNFLHLWRQVYHDRNRRKELKKYTAIISGSADLLELTGGPNSPYNITENLYMKDFSGAEAIKLIQKPFSQLEISIDDKAVELILSQTSGHPQLTQHICHYLLDTARREERIIILNDVNNAISSLLKESANIDMLRNIFTGSDKLQRLIRDILNGAAKPYHPYKKFGVMGTGPIVEDENHCCAIRNRIYECFFRDMLEIPVGFEDIPGQIVNYTNRYDNIQKVGQGAIGTLYKARDKELTRTVALKVLNNKFLKNKKNLSRFKKEAATTARLSHPNIVTVYDIGEVPSGYYLSMEFIEGKNLSKIIDENKEQGLTFSRILYILKALLKALDYSHRKGVVHRDIKPKNVMINREGEIKIVDFGVAVVRDYSREEDEEAIIGSPLYISPEQIKKQKVDHRADIYSAGVTLFHMVTGRPPFFNERGGEAIFIQHLSHPVPSIKALRPDTPGKLIEIIETCMEKDRKKRYRSAGEILGQLKAMESYADEETIVKNEIKMMISPGKTDDAAETLVLHRDKDETGVSGVHELSNDDSI